MIAGLPGHPGGPGRPGVNGATGTIKIGLFDALFQLYGCCL